MRVLALSLLMIAALPAGRQAMAADSAASLIEAVSRAASNAGTWEAEGRVATQESADVAGPRTEASFRIVIERVPTQRARLEITGVPAPLVRVCDGTFQWGYLPAAKQYWGLKNPKIDGCAEPFNEWPDLAADLHEVVIAGQEQLRVGKEVADYIVLGGEYAGPNVSRSGRRTLWVDKATKTIWQYRVERDASSPANPAAPAVRIYTLLRQTSDGVRQADDFALQHSDDSVMIPRPPALRLGDGAPLHVTAPVVLYKVEPKYSEKARHSRIEGTVVLYAEVWPDGAAHNFKVVRSLDPGLDQKAIEAVSKWKFRPGTKDGVPVAAAATFEVNFRLTR